MSAKSENKGEDRYYGIISGHSTILWHHQRSLHDIMASSAVTPTILWHHQRSLHDIMASSAVTPRYYGIISGHSTILWHHQRSLHDIMASSAVTPRYYGIISGHSTILWHHQRSLHCRCYLQMVYISLRVLVTSLSIHAGLLYIAPLFDSVLMLYSGFTTEVTLLESTYTSRFVSHRLRTRVSQVNQMSPGFTFAITRSYSWPS